MVLFAVVLVLVGVGGLVMAWAYKCYQQQHDYNSLEMVDLDAAVEDILQEVDDDEMLMFRQATPRYPHHPPTSTALPSFLPPLYATPSLSVSASFSAPCSLPLSIPLSLPLPLFLLSHSLYPFVCSLMTYVHVYAHAHTHVRAHTRTHHRAPHSRDHAVPCAVCSNDPPMGGTDLNVSLEFIQPPTEDADPDAGPMRFCLKCNGVLGPQAKFCNECGTPVPDWAA